MTRLAALASLLLSSSALAQPAPPPAGPPGTVVIEADQVVVEQPGPTVAPAPPPPTAAWNQVSHINGQPVPVGQKNDYFYEYRRTNVSTNPIGWVLGLYGVSVSYGLNQHLAIRGDVNYYAPIESSTTGYEVGVGLPLYLRRTYQGAFLEPGFIVRHTESGSGDSTAEIGPQVLAGWHWTWDSGFNVAAAFGVGRNWSTADSDEEVDDDGLFANGYLRFGYAF